jgi:phage shock protein A
MLKARVKAAEANKQLQSAIGNLGTSSAMSAFERMEEKVLLTEAESQAAAEIGGTGLEEQFAMLESGSGVDDELAMLKASLAEGNTLPAAQSAGALPQATPQPVAKAPDSVVDAELEQLRSQLKDI